ncbi:uncharacterized protein METZ01_LOCUS421980 [marine metagenome]|jgi:hypothetical protein|uniref:Uncharacterized protein n=1 Tax=marine metagenome TaxID=408172 RepID=A0A382XD73_9ZZZZ|tara:strand:- start:773 stop:895 length:123 start_codon:yes stop_codon:yes gene_type:complete
MEYRLIFFEYYQALLFDEDEKSELNASGSISLLTEAYFTF